MGVRNPGLPVTLLEDGFTYVAAPTIISVKPAKGPIEGGTKVTIKGTGFGPDAVVAVGNVILENAKVVGDSTITIVMPPAVEPIKVDISVTNPGEPRALAKRAFTYTATAPEPTPTPTAQALTRCRPVSGGTVTGTPGSELVLDQRALFPASAGVTRPRLESATFQPTSGPSDGTIRSEPSPPSSGGRCQRRRAAAARSRTPTRPAAAAARAAARGRHRSLT